MTNLDEAPRGRWYEELEVGHLFSHAAQHTVTESDNISFSSMTQNPAALHLDSGYAATTEFEKPLVNSLFTLALLVGLSVADTTMRTTVANLGFETIKFPKPVFVGDTIRAETEVVATRPSRSRPSNGVVTFEHRAFQQDDVLVCSATRVALMHCKP